MKRIFLLLAFVITAVSAAQAQKAPAKAAFMAGDYATAMKLYQAALATAGNSSEQADLSVEMRNARICADLLQRANRLYVNGQYKEAKKSYQEILSYNGSDKFAAQRVEACNRQINQIAIRQQDKGKFNAALKKGSAEALKAYIASSTNNKNAAIAKDILARYDSAVNEKDNAVYMEYGDLFSAAGNRAVARNWYDRAASFGNAEALYKKAMTYDDLTSDEAVSLFALAYAGGYEKAYVQISNSQEYKKVGPEVFERLYNGLCKYKTDIQAFVYVFENQIYYNLDSLNLKHHAQNHLTQFNPHNSHYDDNMIYQLGMTLESMNINPQLLMEFAASQGNINAVEWMCNHSTSMSPEESKAYKLYMESISFNEYKKEGFDAYIKYLKGEKLTRHDWWEINLSYYTFALERHEQLLAKSFGYNNKTGYKYLKNYIKAHKNEVWDSNVIAYITQNIAEYSPKYAKKIIKQLSKLNTKSGIYDKKNNATYKLVAAGYYDNQHKYVPQIEKETKWIYRLSGSYTLDSNVITSSDLMTRKDHEVMNFIYSHGGRLVLSGTGTGISKDGSTMIVISAKGNNRIVVSVSGVTGRGVEFTNRPLTLYCNNGSFSAKSAELRYARYSSFSVSMSMNNGSLMCYVSYVTASYARYSISKTFR